VPQNRHPSRAAETDPYAGETGDLGCSDLNLAKMQFCDKKKELKNTIL